MRLKELIFLFTATCLLYSSLLGADLYVSATLDPYDSVLIGDHVTLEINLETDEGIDVLLPTILDTLTNFEIISFSKPDTAMISGKQVINMKYLLSAYDSGIYVVDAIPFYFTSKTGEKQIISTEALALQVNTLAIDTAQIFKAIKPPIEVPMTLADLWPWLVIGLLLLCLIAVTLYLFKKKGSKSKPVSRPSISLPPHLLAGKKFDQLEAKKLWQQGKVKEYYIELSEILREYLELRFDILALESTTSEILQQLNNPTHGNLDLELLEGILTLSDFVKFAKVIPLANENSKCLSDSRSFVRNTIPALTIKTEEVADV